MLNLNIGEQYAAILEEVQDRLAELDWDRIYAAIALILEGATKENFDNEAAPDGTPWEPLKHPRRRSTGQDKILQDTGLLKASLSAQGQYHIQRHDGRAFEWGTNLDYAATHQFGDPDRNIPARPFVGLNDEVLAEIEELLIDEIQRVFG